MEPCILIKWNPYKLYTFIQKKLILKHKVYNIGKNIWQIFTMKNKTFHLHYKSSLVSLEGLRAGIISSSAPGLTDCISWSGSGTGSLDGNFQKSMAPSLLTLTMKDSLGLMQMTLMGALCPLPIWVTSPSSYFHSCSQTKGANCGGYNF